MTLRVLILVDVALTCVVWLSCWVAVLLTRLSCVVLGCRGVLLLVAEKAWTEQMSSDLFSHTFVLQSSWLNVRCWAVPGAIVAYVLTEVCTFSCRCALVCLFVCMVKWSQVLCCGSSPRRRDKDTEEVL